MGTIVPLPISVNRFINHAAAVQCLSQREMEMTHFGKHKFVGTNGVYMPDKAKTDFRTEGIKFIYIGRLEMHIKGLDLLLDAVKAKADLLRQHQCTFDLYGPDILGRAAAVAELIEKNGVGDIVTLHPPISGVEKENALLDADIFIQTSRSEGMPMGILEALSYGLPGLVTEGTTLAYFVNEQRVGWGCETNSKAVAEMMEKACVEYGSLLEKSTRAREAILGNFAWDVVARDTVERYEEIVKHQWQNADRKGG